MGRQPRKCCVCEQGGFWPSFRRLIRLGPGTEHNSGTEVVHIHQGDCFRELIGVPIGDRGHDWRLNEVL